MMIQISDERWREVKEQMCDDFCKWPTECPTQGRLDRHCEECPMNTVEYPLGYCPHQE